MADPGFLSGFIGKGIDIAINQILHHAGIAVRCKKELNALRGLVRRIEPITKRIRQYRLELNRKRGTPIAESGNNSSQWVMDLHDLLRRALPIVQQCTIPSFNVFARYQMSKDISNLISEIKEHLEVVPLVLLEQQAQMHLEMRRESAQASGSTSASTSQSPTGSFFIEDVLVVGQDQAFATLEKLVIDAELKSLFRTGVVGKGGSGKTLLLKRVFNSQKVRELFRDDLLLWLTISESPSFSSLRNELRKQIDVQTKVDHDPNMNEEDVKTWLSRIMQDKRFVLFFDDVWGGGRKLLEELGLSRLTEHSNSKIIVSSRNRRALIEMGIADTSPLALEDLSEEKSWELFAHHAFPYNNGNPPANIDQRRAKLVCDKCGGLPLAIKVIGSTMAGITDAQEWELAILRLPNANSKDHQALHDRLRLSYDALGDYDANLQLCFLYLAAFIEDEIIDVWNDLIRLWIGEGLLESNEPGHDPFEMGRIYANLLADRCLIEPVLKDVDGRVVRCRMHDMLRGLAIQIAEQEEKFYCRAGNGLTALVENKYSGCTRLFLNNNKLSSLPKSVRASEMCSLLMIHNSVTKIPGKVIGSMISLKVLDLSGTFLESLPKSVGCLKQLACLTLQDVPIKRLPAALTNLASLQILNLCRSKITELPSGIHKLTSLRCLSLYGCDDLQCLPRSISRLTSLQYLDITGCTNVWTNRDKKKAASVNDLRSLTQLKTLQLYNEAESISEGTMGAMLQMETLELVDAVMTSLPPDMMNMSKLKRLDLTCGEMVKMDSRFAEFQNLIYLRLWCCYKLEELSDLQNLKGLRQLHIFRCSKLKKFPMEFGEKGAFPFLEIFSLVELDELEELPAIIEKEDVMPSLKIFTIMKCEALKMLPENYFHLKTLQKIRVYGCSMVLKNLKKIQMKNTQIKLITISTTDIETIIERYCRMTPEGDNWLYHESAYDEHFRFLDDLYRHL